MLNTPAISFTFGVTAHRTPASYCSVSERRRGDVAVHRVVGRDGAFFQAFAVAAIERKPVGGIHGGRRVDEHRFRARLRQRAVRCFPRFRVERLLHAYAHLAGVLPPELVRRAHGALFDFVARLLTEPKLLAGASRARPANLRDTGFDDVFPAVSGGPEDALWW